MTDFIEIRFCKVIGSGYVLRYMREYLLMGPILPHSLYFISGN